MTIVLFATCERDTALQFLAKLYPSRNIEDSRESAGPLLDLVEADVIRISDPHYHDGQIVAGKNWDEAKRAEVAMICAAFHHGS
jgi:hypothetical protein